MTSWLGTSFRHDEVDQRDHDELAADADGQAEWDVEPLHAEAEVLDEAVALPPHRVGGGHHQPEPQRHVGEEQQQPDRRVADALGDRGCLAHRHVTGGLASRPAVAPDAGQVAQRLQRQVAHDDRHHREHERDGDVAEAPARHLEAIGTDLGFDDLLALRGSGGRARVAVGGGMVRAEKLEVTLSLSDENVSGARAPSPPVSSPSSMSMSSASSA